jgi:hypothetical protein
MAYNCLAIIMAWMFDCLMIYRCYIIWSKRWYIIVAPIVLFLASLIVVFLSWLYSPQSPIENKKTFTILAYFAISVNILLNMTTTGLISFRLIRQHRTSRASGIQPSHSRLNLFHVVRIIVESAAIYTLLLLVTLIFHAIGSRNVWILLGINTPATGIALTLISIRLHAVTTRAREPRTTLFTISPWINDNSLSGVEMSRSVQSENQLTPVGVKPLHDR